MCAPETGLKAANTDLIYF